MSTFSAIVFDLDDTLYLERDYVLSGFRAVAAWLETEFGVDAAAAFTFFEDTFVVGSGDTFDKWVDRFGPNVATDIVPDMVRVYREHDPVLTLIPGAYELLLDLRQSYRIGLVSDGAVFVQQRKLAALGIEPLFDAVVFSDTLGRDAWKPSPVPFLAVCERLDVGTGRAVYVADNVRKDFLGARRAGLASIRVRHERGLYRDLEPDGPDHAPDRQITDFNEFAAVLRALA